jgi:hypothetical protein
VLAPLVGLTLLAVGLWASVWLPVIVLRKAGYPGWLAIPFVLTFPLSGVVFALAQWPIYRELAWLRMKAGTAAEPDVALIELYAGDLDQLGDWAKAAEVYETLAAKTVNPDSRSYYENSAQRLRERMKPDGAV